MKAETAFRGCFTIRSSLVVAAVALSMLPVPASAQSSPGTDAGRKSPAAALALSVVLPGAGQAYNGEWDKGILVFGTTVASVGFFGFDGASCLWDDDGENCTRAAVGLGLAAIVVVYSWIDAPMSARAINRRLALGRAGAEFGPKLSISGGSSSGSVRVDMRLARVTF